MTVYEAIQAKDWAKAKREAARIGRFARAMVVGLEAHARREEERARIREGGYVVELAASSSA